MTRKTNESKAIDLHIGARIRQYRIQRGLSQNDLASQLGISYQQLHKYENGANSASASRLAEIARILHVKAADLFSGFSEATTPDKAHDHALRSREQLLLMKYLSQIDDPEKRKAIADLLQSLGDDSQP